MIEDDRIYWTPCRYQFQPQLLLHSRKKIRLGRIIRRCRERPHHSIEIALVRRPIQNEIIPSGEPCFVHHGTSTAPCGSTEANSAIVASRAGRRARRTGERPKISAGRPSGGGPSLCFIFGPLFATRSSYTGNVFVSRWKVSLNLSRRSVRSIDICSSRSGRSSPGVLATMS